jgi:hypothetical protein
MIRAVSLFLLLSCIPLSACSAVLKRAHDPRSPSAVCLPSFPDKDGWYGGDGAYAIGLDGGRVLWLFGDTFVSDQQGRQDRTDMNDAGHLDMHRRCWISNPILFKKEKRGIHFVLQ